MKLHKLKSHRLFRPGLSAALTVLFGLSLWLGWLGNWCDDVSYDLATIAAPRRQTNKVVLVLMDNTSRRVLEQPPGQWDRRLHVALLERLTEARCPLVVFDVHFKSPRDPAVDTALARAMERQSNVVLMADVEEPKAPGINASQVVPPHELFLNAAAGWGIANAGVNRLEIARRHWPFDQELPFPSMPQAAARLVGAQFTESKTRQWLRYYGENGAWATWSYHLALSNSASYFRDKIVFVGREPERSGDPDFPEEDKFRSPFTVKSRRAVGGVEIMATTFLNLWNGDYLRRFPAALEVIVVIVAGVAVAVGMMRWPRAFAVVAAVGMLVGFSIGGVLLTYLTNYWFPWVVLLGEVSCALAVSLVMARRMEQRDPKNAPRPEISRDKTLILNIPEDPLPEAPEYELLNPPIGQGGFGKVWIARNAIGQWQALKAVYASKFGDNRVPYETEFNGLQRYKPVSEKHPGLLRIELVSRMKEQGYFYYVMELGDAQAPGWENDPSIYRPKDLEWLRKQQAGHRLPREQCIEIVTSLAEALSFLHREGLTHRDIKPSNVIFVGGRPKLADIGLVAAIRPLEEVNTFVGTLGFMPPPPEKPGTVQADIYALGMLLYVISTGSSPALFPSISSSLVQDGLGASGLNHVILTACQPDLALRYQTTSDLLHDLKNT